MIEPTLSYCGVREGLLEDGTTEIHLECRFTDGQKFAPIVIDEDHDNLAYVMKNLLNWYYGADWYVDPEFVKTIKAKSKQSGSGEVL